jgi:small-conductance mechanosensitive channel
MARVKEIVHRVLDSLENIRHPTPGEEQQPFFSLIGRLQPPTGTIDSKGLEPRMMIVDITPTTITIEVRMWIDDFRRRDAIKGELMDALNSSLLEIENPIKVDDKMLVVLRQMLDEMKERQTKLEEIEAQRDIEELRTR